MAGGPRDQGRGCAPLSLSLSLTHAHTHTRSLSHSHTRTLSLSLLHTNRSGPPSQDTAWLEDPEIKAAKAALSSRLPPPGHVWRETWTALSGPLSQDTSSSLHHSHA